MEDTPPIRYVEHVGGEHAGEQPIEMIVPGLPDVVLYRSSIDGFYEHYSYDPIGERYVYNKLVERKPMKRTYFNQK
jgi:hypothetical protein